jgi:hypothetical protein
LTDAEVIVRVTAIGYTKSPAGGFWTTGVPEATIVFRVEEMLKGEASAPATLTVNGYLNDRDDFNDRPVPYDFIRPGGRAGSCIANSYKKGAEFLFFLKKREGRLTPYWAALTPTNEQLRASDDAWLKWVRDSLQSNREAWHRAEWLPNLSAFNIFRWWSSTPVRAI